MDKIGEKIKNLRKQAGLSQEELAEKLHVSRQTVFKWEAGKAIPDTDNVVLMSKLFQVPLEELLYDEIELEEHPRLDLQEPVEETQAEKEVCVSTPQAEEVDFKKVKTLWVYALVAMGLGLSFLISYVVGALTLTEGGYTNLAGMIAGFFTLANAAYVAPFVALFYLCQQTMKGNILLQSNARALIARFVVFVAVVVGLIFLPVAICIAIAGSVYGYFAVEFAFLGILLSIFTYRAL